MASEKEISDVLVKVRSFRVGAAFKPMDENSAGVGAVLCFLDERDGSASSGEIAANIHVSTARTAALLQKMEAAGLIRRSHDEQDRRVTIVSITEEGRAEREKRACVVRSVVGRLLDEMGAEKMHQFLSLCSEMKDVIVNMQLSCGEGNNTEEIRKGNSEQ